MARQDEERTIQQRAKDLANKYGLPDYSAETLELMFTDPALGGPLTSDKQNEYAERMAKILEKMKPEI
jgi:hypothetical protein